MYVPGGTGECIRHSRITDRDDRITLLGNPVCQRDRLETGLPPVADDGQVKVLRGPHHLRIGPVENVLRIEGRFVRVDVGQRLGLKHDDLADNVLVGGNIAVRIQHEARTGTPKHLVVLGFPQAPDMHEPSGHPPVGRIAMSHGKDQRHGNGQADDQLARNPHGRVLS
ncbi:hypothetical protein D9M71_494690 [compost metagenome]